jgi:hypothetical protein
MSKKSLITDFNFWRQLINVWTILFFGIIIYNFWDSSSGGKALNVVSIIYIGALAIYVSNKEFERWYNHHDRRHPGEVFVILWSVLMAVLLVLDFTGLNSYHLPESVVSSYIAVLTILAITRKSKQSYQSRQRKK